MPENPRSMWKELRERKVVRVAALYAAVGWGVVLGGAELAQILELPVWVPKLILVLAVLGFPVALVLAWAFEMTPEGVRRAAPLSSPSADRPSRMPFIAGVVVGIASISLVAFLVGEGPDEGSSESEVLDDDLVAVLPFRYSGPPDLDYLGDGVFQLLASRFTGEVGPRAVDPTATASVWDEVSMRSPTTAARDVALRLEAGLVLSGGVVAGPDGLSLTATLRGVVSDEEIATASAQGPPDSLNAVVERLASSLLSLSVGEYEESLAQLTSADPEALQEYLLGQVEFRHGRWFSAYDHFERAVEVDSTFALASLWMADAGNNVPGALSQEALERAWRHRSRLSERDRTYLEARLGPNYRDPDTRQERRRAYQEAARLTPDRANIWYLAGRAYRRASGATHDELIPGSSSAPWYHVLYYAFQDLGRPRQADQMLAEHERARGEVSHRMRVLDAIYGAMPEEVGAVSAAAIEGWLKERSEDESSSAGAVAARTTLELWRVAHDDLSRVDDAAALYRSFQPAQPEAYRKTLEAQALLLEAMARVRQGEDTLARPTIERMDEIFLQGPPGIRVDLYDAMVLATADVYERLGDPEKALLVLERESNFDNSRWPYGATFARERGRLAGLTGDTVRAIREYEFYVRMRASAEPALEPEVEDVRAALTELRGG